MRFASHVELWRKGMKANARRKPSGEGKKRARGERREWEKGKRPGRLRCPLSPLLPLPECPPYLGVLSPPRCGEWATSLARALYHHPTLRVSSLCVRWNALLVRVEARTEGQGNALCVCVWARVCAFSRFRSLALLFTVGKASRWIRVNAVRLTLIRRRSFIRTASSLFDAKPLYTHTPPISVCSPLLACVYVYDC